MKNYLFALLFALFLSAPFSGQYANAKSGDNIDAIMAWPRTENATGIVVSEKRKDKWSDSHEFTSGTGIDVTPSVTVDADGNTFLVWSATSISAANTSTIQSELAITGYHPLESTLVLRQIQLLLS